jgi:hypothetical protein
MPNVKLQPLYPLEREPVSTVQEAEWGSGTVWMDPENLVPTGFRTPERSAISEALRQCNPI